MLSGCTMCFLDLRIANDACTFVSLGCWWIHGTDAKVLVQVIADSASGLVFKNKRDRKTISVDPSCSLGDNSTRTDLPTSEYVQVVLYDHVTRRRA